MTRRLRLRWLGLALSVVGLAGVGVAAAGDAAAGDAPETDEFFETRVRPVLAERCWSCHGEQKQFAGLRLDSRAGMVEGGDSGPSVEPGSAEESLLIQAVRQTDEALKMPPKGKLEEAQIADLTAWVAGGARWPDVARAAPPAAPGDASSHWAFQPVRRPRLPAVKDAAWPVGPIDRYVLERLERDGLTPSPEADRRTLIRRLSFDLLGLPPKPEAVEAFVADTDPAAYERLVDRLLASPQYGERWGRHWLDVARYADTKGYVFQEERRYPFSYTYRDWVIHAFNQDLPYDQFVVSQLAAEAQASPGDPSPLAAMGFLTVGRRFLNNQQDIIDDRIDVTTRGLIGLTVACARCHDHKYDPIPTEDYYSLYGVFASSEEPEELPRLEAVEGGSSPEFREYQSKRAELEKAVDEFLEGKRKELQDEWDKRREEYEKAAAEVGTSPSRDRIDSVARERKLRPELVRWGTMANAESKTLAAETVRRILDRDGRNKLRERERKVAQLDASHPGAPARAMVMVDRAQLVKPRVFQRGNPGRPGSEVPRRFLKALSGPERPEFTTSGRLELARAIVDPANPLTARVFVNRVWMHHFGQGLVRTPSDFGLRSDPPSHPELLDWLASTFVANGWSVKQLHRTILNSRTYRQQSVDRAEGQAKDPENNLLWKQNRQRLEFEPLRDALLAVSGQLDTTMGGRSVDITTPRGSPRRTVYAFIDRQNLDGMFRAFDFASPDATVPKRFVTTVPQQSLFLLNHPSVAARAREAVQTVRATPGLPADDAPAQIRALYTRLFGRPPLEDEQQAGLAYLEQAGKSPESGENPPADAPLEAWTRYAQVLLLTNEFAFVD